MQQFLTKIYKHWLGIPMSLILLFSPVAGVADVQADENNSGLNQPNQGEPLRQVNAFNDVDPAWSYTGSWLETKTDGSFGGQIHVSNTLGDSATINIIGGSFTLIYTKSPEYGKMTIYVDGKKAKTIDQRGAKTTHQKEWTNSTLVAGEHTIKIVNEFGNTINIDAIRIDTITPVNTAAPLPSNTPLPTNVIPTDLPTLPPTSTPIVLPSEIPTLDINPTATSASNSVIPTNTVQSTTIISTPAATGQASGMMQALSVAQAPYGGTTKTLPGTIQAEDFDTGGEGVAYHDTTSNNTGGFYRTAEAVDIEATIDSGGGYNLGWIKAGEWYKYTVNITSSAAYSITLRLASPASGGTVHVEVDGVNVTGSISVPNTGGFQAWQTISKDNISLPAGQHVIRLVFDTEASNGYVGNINSLTFSLASSPTVIPPTISPSNTPIISPTQIQPNKVPQSTSQLPYGGMVKVLPTTVQAEDFDIGGEGVSYHDTTATNEGGKYRANEAVDIEASIDAGGGYNIGWVKAGEWYEYTVNVPTNNTYVLSLRLSNSANGASLHVEIDGINVTGAIAVPNTGGFQKWQTVTKDGISIPAGQHVVKVVFDNAASNGFVGNFNFFGFTTGSVTTQPTKIPATAIPTNLPTNIPTNVPTNVPTNTPVSVSQAPYAGAVRAIPGIIQVEDYDLGGEGIAYHDTTAINDGGQYRVNEGVDIENTLDTGGGYSMGWGNVGEWFEYTSNVSAAGPYSLSLRVANTAAGGTVHIEVDGINVTGSIAVPNTGGFQTWQTITKDGILLSAGQHVIKLVFDTAASNGVVGNFNFMTFSQGTSTPPTTIPATSFPTSLPTNTPVINPTVIPSLVPTFTPTTIAPIGNVFYVSTSGNDANPGTQAQPWRTIQKALNSVPNGATILVAAGTYNERPIVSKNKQLITLRAQGRVVTNGFHIAGNNVTIDGFEITATSSTYIDGFGIWVQGSNCVIQNNYIHDTAWGGILLLYYTDHCTIRNNRIVGNISQNGIDIRGSYHTVEGNEIADVRQMSKYLPSPPSYADADGIHFHGTGHVIRNNYIHDIPYGGDNVNTHTDCFQTFDGLTEQPKAVNVLIESNRCENIGAITNEILTKGMQVQAASNLIIRNNIFCAAVGIRIASNSTVTVENNQLCSNPTLPTNIVSDCMQFESSTGVINNNTCNNFSSWAVRLDNSPNVSGSGNIVTNTKIRSGTEYLFLIK